MERKEVKEKHGLSDEEIDPNEEGSITDVLDELS
jgi:hypothetical protein